MMNNKWFQKNTSRVLAMILAASMIVSLGVDVSSTTNVYAAETTQASDSTGNAEDTDQDEEIDENSVDAEIGGHTRATSSDDSSNEESASDEQGDVTYTCGLEEHRHTSKCYTETVTDELICGKEEGEVDSTTKAHEHTLDCYKGVEPTCGKEERGATKGHTHELSCYGDKVLTCENEDEGHEHTIDCYDLGDPTCGQEESESSEGHTHTLDCYSGAEPTCGLTEGETTGGHQHDKSCYKTTKELTCGEEAHIHTDACKTQSTGVIRKAFSRIRSLSASNDAISVASIDDDETTGINMGDYVNNASGGVKFYKSQSGEWVESTEFTNGQSAKGTINFADVKRSDVVANGNKLYIDLPKGLDCSAFKDKTYKTTDKQYDGGNTESGTYQFVDNGNGTWRIVLTLTDEYMTWAEENKKDDVEGSIDFEFKWDVEKSDTSTTKNIQIGDWSGDITINPDSSSKQNNYDLSKDAVKHDGKDIYYSTDGKTLYVDYRLKLTVKNDTTGPITMTDTLTGQYFTYDTTDQQIAITNKDEGGTVPSVSLTTSSADDAAEKNATITIGDVNTTITAGTYYITYRVKSTVDVTSLDYKIDDKVQNKVVLEDEKSEHNESETVQTKTTAIKKDGKSSKDGETYYIDYTVTLNKGDIIKNLKDGEKFTDVLPEGVTLDKKDITIQQYKPDGSLNATLDTNSVNLSTSNDQTTMTYQVPSGQYYYVIKYRVKVTKAIPIGGTTFSNSAKTEEGNNGTDKKDIKIDNSVLTKSFVEQTLAEKEGTSKWYNTMKWTSTIDLVDVSEGVYQDWSETDTVDNGQTYFLKHEMSEEQRAAIKLYDASGTLIDNTDGSKYTITQGTKTENGLNISLFQITFKKNCGITGPVTIEYETTADMSHYDIGKYFQFKNHSSFTKNGETDTADAEATKFLYKKSDASLINKYGEGYNSGATEGTTELKPGQDSIKWTIALNEIWDGKHSLEQGGDLTVEDTIEDNLTFLPDTVSIALGTNYDYATAGVTWSYDETTRKLTFNIPKEAYSGVYSDGTRWSQTITITYRTKLPENFLKGDEAQSFHNKADLTYKGGTASAEYTQKVSKKIVGKSGSFDVNTRQLSYQINVNPDGATINSGNAYQVYDYLQANKDSTNNIDYDILQNVRLLNLQLYEMVKTTDSNGNVTMKPGKFIQELTRDELESGKKTKEVTPSEFHYVAGTYTDGGEFKGLDFSACLPDSKAYVLVANYDTSSIDPSVAIGLYNRVQLAGRSKDEAQDSSTKIEKYTDGTTGLKNADILTVAKLDNADATKALPGAKFILQQYDSSSSTWKTATYKDKNQDDHDIGTLTTGSNGKATIGGYLTYDTLFRLIETEAPAGYLLDSTPTYFMISYASNASSAKNNLPATVKSYTDPDANDSSYSKDDVKVCTVTDKTADKTYYANIEIKRYDTKGDKLVFKKTDETTGTTLAGATFAFQEYDNGNWTDVTYTNNSASGASSETIGSFTTGEDGTYTISGKIAYDVLYRIQEQTAPAGYVKDNSYYYFIITKEETKDSIISTLQSGNKIPGTMNTSDIVVYAVKKDATSGEYFADVTVTRTNQPEKPQPGELRIKKVWQDAAGNDISDSEDVKDYTAEVTLYKVENLSNPTLTIKSPSQGWDDKSYSGGKGGDVVITLNAANYGLQDGSTMTASQIASKITMTDASGASMDTPVKSVEIKENTTVITIGPINSDCIITGDSLANGGSVGNQIYWSATSYVWSGGVEETGTVETSLGTKYLTKNNNWSDKWTGLTTDVRYKITEKTIDGYTTTYRVDGSELTAGTAFNLNADGSTVTVTNKKDKTSLTVNKVWKGAATESVSVTLKRYKTSTNPAEIDPKYMGTASLSGTATRPDGSEWQSFNASEGTYPPGTEYTFKVIYSGSNNVDAPVLYHNGVEITPTYEVDGSKRTWAFNFTLVSGSNVLTGHVSTNETGTAWGMEGSANSTAAAAARGTFDQNVETNVTLNADSNWSHEFKDLPLTYKDADGTTGYYRYEVVEDTSSLTGYTTTYDYNDYQSGVITITNTKQYDLPKTGGTGTFPWVFGGSFAVVLSLLSGAVVMRRKYKLGN